MKIFEITTPDGRKVRHAAKDAADAASRLMPGYAVTGEVLGADGELLGGYVLPIGAKSLLGELLERHGDELLAWLTARVFTRFDP